MVLYSWNSERPWQRPGGIAMVVMGAKMGNRSATRVSSVVMALLFAIMGSSRRSPAAQTDDLTKSHANAKQQPEGAKKSPHDQPILLDLKPVSTTEAVRSLAKEMAKRPPDPEDKSASDNSTATEAAAGQSDPSAVTEFQPSRVDGSAPGAVVVNSKDSKKSAMKNVHGSVAGVLDPNHRGDRQAAASVGASSKSGKTSVYIETDKSRIAPPPH